MSGGVNPDPDPEEIGGIRWRVQGDPTWYEWAGQNVEWGFKQNLNIAVQIFVIRAANSL